MSDVALMMRSVGIVQHVNGGWSSFSSVIAMSKQIPLLTTHRHAWNRLDDFAGKGGCPKELMKCDQMDSFFNTLNLTQYPLHERRAYMEQIDSINDILQRKPGLADRPSDQSLRFNELIARKKELEDYLTGVTPIRPSLYGYA